MAERYLTIPEVAERLVTTERLSPPSHRGTAHRVRPARPGTSASPRASLRPTSALHAESVPYLRRRPDRDPGADLHVQRTVTTGEMVGSNDRGSEFQRCRAGEGTTANAGAAAGGGDVRTRRRHLDIVGALLSVVGVGGLVLGILAWQEGGESKEFRLGISEQMLQQIALGGRHDRAADLSADGAGVQRDAGRPAAGVNSAAGSGAGGRGRGRRR